MTNFEKIKSMTIEEIAHMLMCPAEYDLVFNKTIRCHGEFNRDCDTCTKHWLESEAEE